MSSPHPETDSSRLAPLSLAALGVVYGDIGTSPLYALRECFHGPHALSPTRANVLGVLSLVFWTLAIVVTLKYLAYVLRADNRGEGGILALMALVRGQLEGRRRWLVLMLGLFGAALLYADGVLTPAISVLGAVEGLTVLAPGFGDYVVPTTVAILIGLFLFQHRGTAGIGAVFGPVMVVWFVTLAILGIVGIARQPGVVAALDPRFAFHFFAENGVAGFLVLGAVFLVATGGEALYADLGHFGRRPILLAWFWLAGPALLLNYFGQGALLLTDPGAAANPFYLLAPSWALVPLMALATMAAVIASQAILTGAFSLTRQAVQLGYLPRVEIVHTSAAQIGQIYIPSVNYLLMAATVGLTIGFRSSSNIAAAYGVALTTTMLITTLLASVVARKIWRWPIWIVLGVTVLFLVPDLAFFGAAVVKIPAGGWFPLVLATGVLAIMIAWHQGRAVLLANLGQRLLPVESILRDIERHALLRVPGTAVYLTNDPNGTPIALLHSIKHHRVVHQRVVFLTVAVEEVPHVPAERRLEVTSLGGGFHRLLAHYGFMEDADVPVLLAQAQAAGLELDAGDTTYILSRVQLLPAAKATFARWRRLLFMFLSRNALEAERFFRLPPNRVLEIWMQTEI